MNRSASDRPCPQGGDCFAILGLPRRFELDGAELEQVYLALAKETHPDRFAGAGSGERRAAMERSAAINEAYRVLRDPVRRAEYLVRLGGIDLDSSDREKGAPAMSQAFLLEMIERREGLAAARARGAAALDEVRAGVEDEMDEVFERAVGRLRAGDVAAAARDLVEHRYLQRLLDEIDEAVAV